MDIENDTTPAAEESAPQDSFAVELSEDGTPQNVTVDDEPTPKEAPKADDREQLGKRAEKRIRGLVSQTKELQAAQAEQEAELKRLREENAKLQKAQVSSQTQAIDVHIGRVEAERKAAERDYRDAAQSEDTDKQLDAMRRLQQAETQLMALNSRKSQMSQEPETEEEPAAQQQEQPESQPITDQRTLDWVEKNPWVKSLSDPSADPEDQEMARFAGRLHNYATQVRLLDPIADADEYWKQIDDGLKAEFPERFADSAEPEESEPAAAPAQTTANPRRPSRSKRKVKLTQAQVDFARRYGISTEEMAKQQAALDARNEE